MKASKWFLCFVLVIFSAASAVSVFGHVSVNPRKAETGAKHQLFFVRAPVEKEIPVVELGVEVDEQWRKNGGDLNSFQEIPGWTVHVEKDDNGKVKRVFWTGGQAPAETFQMINMSVNTPTEPGKYPFRSWQKYSDDSVVWWNEKPAEGGNNESDDPSAKVQNPYPVVEIRAAKEEAQVASLLGGSSQYTSVTIALVALALSLIALKNGRKR